MNRKQAEKATARWRGNFDVAPFLVHLRLRCGRFLMSEKAKSLGFKFSARRAWHKHTDHLGSWLVNPYRILPGKYVTSRFWYVAAREQRREIMIDGIVETGCI